MSSAPGWYPSPSGGRRYWDGKKWLDLPDPDATPSTDSPMGRSSIPSKPPPSRATRWGVIIVIVLVVGGCAAMVTKNSGKGGSSTNQAHLACDHFRNVSSDISKGVLTTQQIHDKAQEIYDDSAIAPAGVQSAAQQLLASTVADDGAAFLAAISAMDSACSAAGA